PTLWRRSTRHLRRGALAACLHPGGARTDQSAVLAVRLRLGRRGECCPTQEYMATAAAALALIERVDPYCVISTTASAAAIASSVRPGPSCPNSITQRSGHSKVSMGTQPGTLSMAMIGMP